MKLVDVTRRIYSHKTDKQRLVRTTVSHSNRGMNEEPCHINAIRNVDCDHGNLGFRRDSVGEKQKNEESRELLFLVLHGNFCCGNDAFSKRIFPAKTTMVKKTERTSTFRSSLAYVITARQ